MSTRSAKSPKPTAGTSAKAAMQELLAGAESSSGRKQQARASSPATGSPAAKAKSTRSKAKPAAKAAAKSVSASTPGPQSPTKGGSAMDPADIAEAIKEAVAAEFSRLRKELKKASKAAAATSKDEEDAKHVEAEAGKAFRKEKKQQAKAHRDKLAEGAAAGAVLAAGGTPKIDLSGSDDSDDDKTKKFKVNGKDQGSYTEEELINYYRVNGKLPDDMVMTSAKLMELKPRMDQIDKEQKKRFRSPLNRS